MRLYENGVFNTEALKYSIKPAEPARLLQAARGPGKDVDVREDAERENKVDVRMKLEEQNRNQLTFGAGVSQFEGFFGQLSFQTSNFLGRGESLTLSLQAGSRAQNYTLAFTEPFLFDRNITGGVQPVQAGHPLHQPVHAEVDAAASLTFGVPARQRLHADVHQLQLPARAGHRDQHSSTPTRRCCARNPFLQDSLLIGQGGERIISKVTPSIVHNTVDQPIFPTTGRRSRRRSTSPASAATPTSSSRCSRACGSGSRTPRMSLGMRAPVEYIHQLSGSGAAADLREAVPRRRVQRPRIRHPQHRADGSDHRPGARRQQEPAVQRRAVDHDCRSGAG